MDPVFSDSSPLSSDSHVIHQTPSPSSSDSEHVPFTLPDAANDDGTLPPEIANADISFAADRSFVETSSGPAARELKKRYDQHYGVNVNVRSPYAITAFINQHGKQMYRVGRRELEAPAARAEQQTAQTYSASPTSSDRPRHKRRSRLSVHGFLPPVKFKSSARPQTATSPPPSAPRKLRKARSISDMPLAADGSEAPAQQYTGRQHSQSVTAADMPRFLSTSTLTSQSGSSAYIQSHKDIFSDMMNWFSASTSAFSTPSMRSMELGSDTSSRARSVNSKPFGPGISFAAPNKTRGYDDYLPVPSRHLRGMQSNDSMMTARQDAPTEPYPFPPAVETNKRRAILRHPPSMLLISDIKKLPAVPTPPPPEIAVQPHYPTSVFDVLQNYRGLPLFEKLIDEGEDTTVIKMSSAAEESIAPRDDPRFVIWGEIHVDSREEDIISQLSNHGSANASPTLSRKRGKSAASSISVSVPTIPEARDMSGQRVLLAATIERWIAQLTSDLNYDDLLDFFLTYRTYVSAVDLCHLLISRFHWTLEQPKWPKDEMARRVARVRTFVAFRFWLNKFFTVDFLPNRELRLLLSNWLNELIRDPILKAHADGLSTVKKLRKVVKDCVRCHLVPTSRVTAAEQIPSRKSSISPHVLGERFAEATRSDADDVDSDIDLDFYAEGSSNTDTEMYSNPVSSHLSPGFSPTRPLAPTSYSAMTILKQTLPDPNTAVGQATAALPLHHGVFSRAFVKTIGRLGKWKRVLNSHPTLETPDTGLTAEVSAFDLELTGAKDFSTVNGGVGPYLKHIEPPSSYPELPAKTHTPTTSRPQSSTVIRSPPPASPAPTLPPLPFVVPTIVPPEAASVDRHDVRQGAIGDSVPTHLMEETTILPNIGLPPSSARRVAPSIHSFQSNSTESFGDVTSVQPSEAYPWAYNIAPIDELNLSDNSSDEGKGNGPAVPPGLRTAKKHLPNRRDFEFVHPESVSSMGVTSRASVSSEASGSVTSDKSMELGNGPIQQWQVNAIIDSLSDEEEDGDVEAALRRLEGEINPEKQKEKASKVDGWVQSIRQRLRRGDFGDEAPRFHSSSDEEQSDPDDAENNGDEGEPTEGLQRSSSATLLDSEPLGDHHTNPATPLASQTSHSVSGDSIPSSPVRAVDARPMPEDVVPAEILQSRIASLPLMSESYSVPVPFKTFSHADTPRMHRSFVLGYRAETLVEHFSMIDRELFMGIKFEELVLDDWMSCEEVDILDWSQYLRDRTRWKAESRFPQKTSALATVRARFNLVANFTIAEIVLTRPCDRPQLAEKFIRIAWKAYCKSNFSTLVAIVAGLKSDWVVRALGKSWSRIGIWEQRIFKDLKEYTTHTDNFKYIRAAVNAIADREQPLSQPTINTSAAEPSPTNKSKTTSNDRPPAPSACLPFIGIYLSQLYQYSKLPDLVDPTAPHETVSVDPVTSNFDAPAHPDVFSALPPLPPSMQLEPLINIHKQRLIAAVIKSLVTGQHLARRMQFPLDKKLFQKCLKLRGLGPDTLHQILTMQCD